jgi:hypothetical protein
MSDPLAETLDHAPRYPTRQESRIVVEQGPIPWRLDSVLRLRAAHPAIRLVGPDPGAQADRIVDAFRAGAEVYIVGGGDPDTDHAFIDDLADGQPFRPSSR